MAWDQTKPANNSALTSAEIRANFAALQAALGNPDSTLQMKATNFPTVLPTGLGMPVYTRITADSTRTSNIAFADVTGASFAVLANAQYQFEFVLKVVGNTAGSSKFQLTGPAAPTGVLYALLGAGSAVTQAAVAFSTAVLKNHVSTGEEAALIRGYLRNGANAGTVQLQFAQQVSDPVSLIVRAESFVITHQMA